MTTAELKNDISGYLAQLEAGASAPAVAKLPERVRTLRKSAAESFATLGFPTTRNEDWRFTNIAPITERRFAPGAADLRGLEQETLQKAAIAHLDAWQAVFVNGRFVAELSDIGTLQKGLTVSTIGQGAKPAVAAVEKHLGVQVKVDANAFAAWNTAAFDDAIVVHVAANVDVERPVRLLFLAMGAASPQVAHPRVLIVMEQGSRMRLIESYHGLDGEQPVLTNAVVEVAVAPNATLDHYKVQRDGLSNFHVSTTQIRQERDSHYTHTAVNLGAALARNDINLFIGGEGAWGSLNGMYMVRGNQLCDTHTRIDHAMPHCESHELYKGILDGNARGVFNGRIYVHQDAQKTDAKQTNQTLLLSDTAQINSNPQLEIFADDVKCTHGATIGQLEDDHVFYLQARGISKSAAKHLLTYAFANDIVRRIEIETLRTEIERIVLVAQDVPVKLVLSGED